MPGLDHSGHNATSANTEEEGRPIIVQEISQELNII